MTYDSDYGHDPQGRVRLPGIYAATVIDNKDPLNRSRLKVQIHQATGISKTNWIPGCLPVTDTSYHPDHKAHLASDIANMLTTSSVVVNGSVTGTSATGGAVTGTSTETIPALTIVAKNSSYQLNHAHTTPTKSMISKNAQNIATLKTTTNSTTDNLEASAYPAGTYAPNQTGTVASDISNSTTPEHTFHRTVPAIGQLIWVMFIGGNPSYPVWMGVQA